MKKILVIDDEKYILKNLESFFEEQGFKVFCEATARDGLRTAEAEQPDVILLDLDLPDKSGLELSELGKIFPVVIISGKLDMTDQVTRKVMHSCAFVKKPFDLEKLLKTIEYVLDKKNAFNKKDIIRALFTYDTVQSLYESLRLNTGVFFTPDEMIEAIEENMFDEDSKEISKTIEKEIPRHDLVERLGIGTKKSIASIKEEYEKRRQAELTRIKEKTEAGRY